MGFELFRTVAARAAALSCIFALGLGGAACGPIEFENEQNNGGNNGGGNNGAEASGTFTAQANVNDGVFEEEITGQAYFGAYTADTEDGENRIIQLYLVNDTGNDYTTDSIYFGRSNDTVYWSETDYQIGDYETSASTYRTDMLGWVNVGVDINEQYTLASDGGTLTIEEATSNRVRGTFELYLEGCMQVRCPESYNLVGGVVTGSFDAQPNRGFFSEIPQPL